jgi:hypothetical protein
MLKASRTFAGSAWRRIKAIGPLARIARGAALVAGLALQPVGCDRRPPPATMGAHSLVFQRLDGGLSTLSTPPLSTGAAGRTLIVSVGRGDVGAFAPPFDNKSNMPYVQLGTTHTYTNWPRSGTALYALVDGEGGVDHVISASTPPMDEVTLAAIEIVGTRISDFAWNEVLAGSPITSRKITTTGPATLVAFWWGDGGVRHDKTALPNNGFQVIDAVLESGALVQCAVAVKHVTDAGSYDVTWKAKPWQGAQLWIVAVE